MNKVIKIKGDDLQEWILTNTGLKVICEDTEYTIIPDNDTEFLLNNYEKR